MRSWKQLPIHWKLATTHAGIALLTMTGGSFTVYAIAKKSLKDRAFQQLESIRTLQKRKIEESALHGAPLKEGELNEILSERAGLGTSGESYVVDRDFRIRSDSRFVSVPDPMKLKVDTEPVRLAFEGRSGVMETKDYRGIKVLSAYAPLEIGGMDWALLAEIDSAEVLAPLFSNMLLVEIAMFLTTLIVLITAHLLAKSIADPILSRQLSLYEGQEQERSRIARDLHDGVGQLVTAASLSLETSDPMKRAFDQILLEIGNISKNLSSSILSNFGLVPAIRALCEESKRVSGIEFRLKCEESLEPNLSLDASTCRHLYRIAQEAVRNGLQHSKATAVDITIVRSDRDQIEFSIKDNGKGITRKSALRSGNSSGHGLSNMRERAEAMGAKIRIDSSPGLGTEVKLLVEQA